MEALAQESTATYNEVSNKYRRLSEVLLLVCPQVLFVECSKTYDCQADFKKLCVVLEKQEGFWTVVQAGISKGSRKSYTICEGDR